MLYRCAHCKETVERDSTKKWVKSYCDKTGKNVHLQLVENADIYNRDIHRGDMQSILAGVMVVRENDKCEMYTAGETVDIQRMLIWLRDERPELF